MGEEMEVGRLDAGRHPPSAHTARGWAQAHDRAVRALTLSARLQTAAIALGGYASARLRVRLPGQPERRPAVALVEGELPVDGIATRPPLLVVELAPADPAAWLAVGVREVWVVGDDGIAVHRAPGGDGTGARQACGEDGVAVHHADRGAEVLGPAEEVTVPGIGLRLPVAGLVRGIRST